MRFKETSGPDSDFQIRDGVLVRYLGPGGAVSIPDGTVRIGERAFDKCESLTSLSIPFGTASIENYAFSCCRNLRTVSIPGSVTKIGRAAFYGCESLESLVIPGSAADVRELAFFGCRSLRSLSIQPGVTSIGERAFFSCHSLTGLTIPDSVAEIGRAAFYGCENLSCLTITGGEVRVGYRAFYGCRSLAGLTISGSGTYIDGSAFGQAPPCVKCGTPAAAALVSCPLYLGGGPADLNEDTQEEAALGFIHARAAGIRDADRWRQEYLDYIRRHLPLFMDRAETDRQVLLFLLREELADKEAADRFLKARAAADDTEIRAWILDYRRRKFGPEGPEDLSL